jgi:hypothetical protein
MTRVTSVMQAWTGWDAKAGMGLMTLEHSKAAYGADFALYGAAVSALAAYLLLAAPTQLAAPLTGAMLLGIGLWTLAEYALHRFVLHGVQPFKRWHSEHHLRPAALICAPTILSGALIVTLVLLPAWALVGKWLASALTLGVLLGYLAYATTHHAVHHWRTRNDWLKQRKRWHASHHLAPSACFGVTSSGWDWVFGSGRVRPWPQKREPSSTPFTPQESHP